MATKSQREIEMRIYAVTWEKPWRYGHIEGEDLRDWSFFRTKKGAIRHAKLLTSTLRPTPSDLSRMPLDEIKVFKTDVQTNKDDFLCVLFHAKHGHLSSAQGWHELKEERRVAKIAPNCPYDPDPVDFGGEE
jgi:hypothetical protein